MSVAVEPRIMLALGHDNGDEYCHRLLSLNRSLCGRRYEPPLSPAQTHSWGTSCGRPPCPECEARA